MSVQPPHAKRLTPKGSRLHTVLSIGMPAGGGSSISTLQDVSDLPILFFMRDEVDKMLKELLKEPIYMSFGAHATRKAQEQAFMDELEKIDERINEVASSDSWLDVQKKKKEGGTMERSKVPDYARRLLEDIRQRSYNAEVDFS